MAATPDRAQVEPTKAFFVSMLTRDINLVDAVLDLVDNSLDGALRTFGSGVDYSQHWVRISTHGGRFEIKDNCGGISRQLAIEYVFRMGREADDDRDEQVETIGMYGIGMKRAVFKMGTQIKVVSRTEDDEFKVVITPEWLAAKDWQELPLRVVETSERLQNPGVWITVEKLARSIEKSFGASDFRRDLRKALGEHFSLFIQKGFCIELDGQPVEGSVVEVLVPNGEQCRPFFCTDEVGEAAITVIVGVNPRIYRDEDDSDVDPTELREDALHESGWTVYCNDRAIMVGDKSRLTGWGDRIPLFHPQFGILTGMVQFRAKDAGDLPVNTTKRTLDASSEAWLVTRQIMRLGMRAFVDYTNAWKNERRRDQQSFFDGAARADLWRASEMLSEFASAKYDKRESSSLYNPAKLGHLPKPKAPTPSLRRVVFSRPPREVKYLASQLFGNEDERAGLVGERCFERVLEDEGYE